MGAQKHGLVAGRRVLVMADWDRSPFVNDHIEVCSSVRRALSWTLPG
jgi:hypothetical protein